MINTQEFLAIVRVDAELLEAWIEAGWLIPRRDAGGWTFSEMDLARARLICDLKRDFGLNDEGVAGTLDLLDQIYGLRRALREVLSAFPRILKRHGVASPMTFARVPGRVGMPMHRLRPRIGTGPVTMGCDDSNDDPTAVTLKLSWIRPVVTSIRSCAG